MFNRNTCSHITGAKIKAQIHLKMILKMLKNRIIYMHLALNNLQGLICYKTQPNQIFLDEL